MSAAADLRIVPARLPWQQAWTTSVSSHMERTPGGIRTVPWPAQYHATARVWHHRGRWQLDVRLGASSMTYSVPSETSTAGRRMAESIIEQHTQSVAAALERAAAAPANTPAEQAAVDSFLRELAQD